MRERARRQRSEGERPVKQVIVILALLKSGCAGAVWTEAQTPAPPPRCYEIDAAIHESEEPLKPYVHDAFDCTSRYVVEWECASDPEGEYCQRASER